MTSSDVYTIERIAPRAANYLRRLPRQQQEAVAQAFEYICTVSPFRHSNPTTIKPLKGKYKGKWRYRVGNLRIVYTVNATQRTVSVIEIDNRGDVYS